MNKETKRAKTSGLKKISIGISLILLSAGCTLFQTTASAGMVKTVNGGADWQFSNAIANNKTASIGQLTVSKIGFDPANHETLFLGSYSGGLYKSTDSGATWSNILSKINVYDFVISPVDSKTIYVAGIYAGQGKVLKTADGGATWQQIYNDAASNNPVRALDLNPEALNQLLIGTSSGNLIKSSDGGSSWQLATSFSDQVNRIFWRPGSTYVLLKDKGLYRGSGQADSFQQLTASLTKGSAVDYVTGNTMTFNQAYIDRYASSSLMYVTSNQGLYKTTDSGATWNAVVLPVQSQATVHAVAVAPSTSNIVAASVGSIIYKSTDGGSSWQTQSIATAGFINYILIDPQLPQIMYGGIYVASQ